MRAARYLVLQLIAAGALGFAPPPPACGIASLARYDARRSPRRARAQARTARMQCRRSLWSRLTTDARNPPELLCSLDLQLRHSPRVRPARVPQVSARSCLPGRLQRAAGDADARAWQAGHTPDGPPRGAEDGGRGSLCVRLAAGLGRHAVARRL